MTPPRRLFPPRDEATGKRLSSKGRGERSHTTLPGRVAIKRRRYVDPAVGSVTPMAEALDTARQATSVGVAQLCCRLAIDAASFARANECLRTATGLRVSAETLRQVVQSEGKAAQAAQESEPLEMDWHARDCQTQSAEKQTTTRLYMGSDGMMVPTVSTSEKRKRRASAKKRRRQIRKQDRDKKFKALPAMRGGSGKERFKEMKLVVFYDQGGEHRLVRATCGDHRKAGRMMRWGLGQLRAQAAAERIAVIDGAPWIERQVAARKPAFTVITLDFWHLAEHVHAARREVFGEADAAGVQWAEDVLRIIREQGYEGFWDQLVELRRRRRGRRARAALDRLMQYVLPRQQMLDYPRHIQHGWDIGSGPTEAMCKTLGRRVKGGARWDTDNAEAMMALEALHQSNQWDAWWAHRLQAA